MTLLFFDGFDNPTIMQKPEWDSALTWQGPQPGRDGTANGAAGVSLGNLKTITLPTAAATACLGVAMQVRVVNPGVANPFGTNVEVLGFRTGALTTSSVSLTFDSTGRLQLRSGSGNGTVLAVGSTAFQQNAWMHVQVKVTSSASALSVALYLNGGTTPELSYTGASASSQTAAITRVTVAGGASVGASISWAVDDLYVCDTVDATATQGRPNNDLLGDLKVTTLLPTGAGATAQWTPSTGASNVALVAENPPNQTDYVSAATTGLRDTYDTADLPATATTVYAMRVGAYAQKSDAGAASIKPLVREASGTLDGTTAVALGVAWGPAYSNLLTRKGDSTLWSPADVNGAQVGIESA